MYDNVREPVQVGGTTLPNRICRTAHGTGIPWGDGLNLYHEARARGGVGLTILEVAGVHPTSISGIPVYQDGIIADYQRLVEVIKPYGMKLMQQLWHAGNSGISMTGPPSSASEVPSPTLGVTPVPMTKGMIDEIIQAYASAARRVKEGGLLRASAG